MQLQNLFENENKLFFPEAIRCYITISLAINSPPIVCSMQQAGLSGKLSTKDNIIE